MLVGFRRFGKLLAVGFLGATGRIEGRVKNVTQ